MWDLQVTLFNKKKGTNVRGKNWICRSDNFLTVKKLEEISKEVELERQTLQIRGCIESMLEKRQEKIRRKNKREGKNKKRRHKNKPMDRI